MENILELFYNQTSRNYGEYSSFAKFARIKTETMQKLDSGLTDEQKKLLETYFDADVEIEDIIQFDKFRYAFHLGALLMAELLEGRAEVMK